MIKSITNRDLVNAGILGGRYLPSLTARGNRLLEDHSREDVIQRLKAIYKAEYTVSIVPLLAEGSELKINLEANNEAEQVNFEACVATMREASRTPIVRATAILPICAVL